MLYPDDWKNYTWFVTAGLGAGSFTVGGPIDERIWRILAASSAGGTLTFESPTGGAPSVVTLLAGQTITLDPSGMSVHRVTFSAGIDNWIVEWIRQNQ